jgi:hypothetical protein
MVAASLGLMRQLGYQAGTLPQLDILTVDQPLGGGNGGIVIIADDGLEALDMAVAAQDVGAVFGHVMQVQAGASNLQSPI